MHAPDGDRGRRRIGPYMPPGERIPEDPTDSERGCGLLLLVREYADSWGD